MSENKNTAIPVNELEDLQEKEFILHELQKSAKIGWWKVNFNTHEIICSDYIMDILDLSKNTMTVEEFLKHHQRGTQATYLFLVHPHPDTEFLRRNIPDPNKVWRIMDSFQAGQQNSAGRQHDYRHRIFPNT